MVATRLKGTNLTESERQLDRNDHSFGKSSPLSLGVEEELLLVDDELRLAAVGEQVADGMDEPFKSQVSTEIFAEQIELKTGICHGGDEVFTGLSELRKAVRDRGHRLLGSGLYPAETDLAPLVDAPRYQVVRQDFGDLLSTPPCGLHIHVGISDPEAAIRLNNAFRCYLPALEALSANSPFRGGVDTGHASARASVVRSYPRFQLPRHFEDYEDFCRVADELMVAAGVEEAYYAAAALMVLFALLMVGAILAGRAGASCACFGANSRLGWPAVGRNLVMALAFLSLPALPGGELSTDEWLALGLVIALLGLAGLGVAVLALAREVGLLRLRLGPAADSALEIPEEGPPLGERVPPVVQPDRGGEIWSKPGDGRATSAESLRLAVFLSEGCHICRSLEPQVRAFIRDPMINGHLFDEVADSDVWQAFSVPGSPYAVACDSDGTALAKGSFNTVAQLESVLAAAERRRSAIAANLPGG